MGAHVSFKSHVSPGSRKNSLSEWVRLQLLRSPAHLKGSIFVILELELEKSWVDDKSAWWCNNHLEKYYIVNGKDYPMYEMEVIKVMF